MDGVFIRTGDPALDGIAPAVRDFLARDLLDVVADGQTIRGFRSPDARSIWIRDHSDILRGGRYFEPDATSAVTHFAETQSASGRIFDYFTTFPEKLPSERENWTKYVRVPVEADVEYRFVKGAWLAWQASGDDDWIRGLMPNLEAALEYSRTHPWRWDPDRELVKRAYTIDTWDFAYTAGRHEWLEFQITDDTYWGIFHGDNSGFYEAYRLLAGLHDRFGDGAGRGPVADPGRGAQGRDESRLLEWTLLHPLREDHARYDSGRGRGGAAQPFQSHGRQPGGGGPFPGTEHPGRVPGSRRRAGGLRRVVLHRPALPGRDLRG